MNATGPSDQNTSVASNGSNAAASSDVESVTKGKKRNIKLTLGLIISFVSPGLSSWREAVQRSVTSSQLSMALYSLEQCVAWDKSIMKAVSLVSPANISSLIDLISNRIVNFANLESLKTSYCCVMDAIVVTIRIVLSLKWKKYLRETGTSGKFPKILAFQSNISYRFCYECLNKATGERKCIICGGHRPMPVGKLILCELCPRSYHQDCYIPPMLKVNTQNLKFHD